MTVHLAWETLNDYADNLLPQDDRTDAARHLAGCNDCREQLAAIRRLIATASDAAERIEAPPGAWPSLRAELERRGTGSMHQAEPERRRAGRTHRAGEGLPAPAGDRIAPLPVRASLTIPRPALLAAAALLLVVGSSALTARIMSRGGERPAIARAAGAAAPGAGDTIVAVALSGEMARTEAGYLQTVRELSATLSAERAHLSPVTVAAVERSLRVIDAAIVEARTALASDPASPLLRDAFSRNYQQKVDLLRRASALLQHS